MVAALVRAADDGYIAEIVVNLNTNNAIKDFSIYFRGYFLCYGRFQCLSDSIGDHV